MDYMILGLLLLSNRTIYELRERIRKGLHLIYSDSMGSIQNAVKQLLRKNYIDYEELTENGRHKKSYYITDAGKTHFMEWINSPMVEQAAKQPELGKIYFMGFSTPENRMNNIHTHITSLKQQYAILCAICKEGDDMAEEYAQNEVFRYQLVTAQYGRDLMKFNITWYEKLLQKMKGERE